MKLQILLTPLSLWAATGSSCATYGGICHLSSRSRMDVAIRARSEAKERLDRLLPYVRSTRMMAAHLDELGRKIDRRSSLAKEVEVSIAGLESHLKSLNVQIANLNSEIDDVEFLIEED